jgi:hypothetical protein
LAAGDIGADAFTVAGSPHLSQVTEFVIASLHSGAIAHKKTDADEGFCSAHPHRFTRYRATRTRGLPIS